MPLPPGEVPGHWACKCGSPVTVSSATLTPKDGGLLLSCPPQVTLPVRAGIPGRTKPTNREHQVGNQGNPIFPESGVCPPHCRPQIHFPCPPPPASLCGVCTSCPEAQGHSSTSPTMHTCVRASFPTAHQHCMEFVVKSFQTQARPQFWTAQLHKSTDAIFVTAPPLHLTKCWLSFGVAARTSTAPLLAQVLTCGFRGTPAPPERPQALLLSLPASLGTEKQVPVELSCQSAGLLWSRIALRVQKRKGDEIPEQWRTCASHQVHNAQPVKYSKHVSQASGIWAKSLQGNICVSSATVGFGEYGQNPPGTPMAMVSPREDPGTVRTRNKGQDAAPEQHLQDLDC